MTETEIGDGLYEIIRTVIGDPSLEISPTTTAKDVPGWDSLKQVMIMLGVEDRFNVRLSSREIDSIKCVGDLLGVISRKIS
jgi:acyl carrier protein